MYTRYEITTAIVRIDEESLRGEALHIFFGWSSDTTTADDFNTRRVVSPGICEFDSGKMGDTLVEDTKPVTNGQKFNGDVESQLQALEEKARVAQENFEREEKLRKELEEQNTKLLAERNAMQRQLEGDKGSLSEYMEKSLKLAAQKADLESQLQVSVNY